MKELQLQYKALKKIAKQLMSIGDLQAYFGLIKRINTLQLQILQQRYHRAKSFS